MKILFCNIGWMEFYRGQSSIDRIVGGGSYVKNEGMGHEVCNFADHEGTVYGYVQPPKADGQPGLGQINIDRLGGKDNLAVTGVLVIWTATRPEGGTVVVGWYKNATIHRYYQKFTVRPKLHSLNNLRGFRIEAKASDVTLLPIDKRTCSIPRRVKGGMGQANVWFADAPESQGTVALVLELVEGNPKSREAGRTQNSDPDHNAKVEQAAVDTVRDYYERNGYRVESVEKDNVGWDLEAFSGNLQLRVEVKGLSGVSAVAQLTPNEYKAFAELTSSYRLAIVTSALSSPNLTICRYSLEGACWVAEGEALGEVIIQKRESAIVSVGFKSN